MKRATLLLFALFATLLAIVGALLPANVALAEEYAISVGEYRGNGSGTIKRLVNGE